jgi:hypothetical protein
VILIPAATIAGLSAEQLEMVLAHELAHIRRFDHLVNLGQMLIETLLFYHPSVWWVSAQIRQERELCCDDAAVRVCGNPIAYARALTELEKLRPPAPLVAIGAASNPLLYRIQRLMGIRKSENSSSAAGVLAICTAITCLVFNVNWARGQAPLPAPRPAPPTVSIPVAQTAPKKKPRSARKTIQPPVPSRGEVNPWLSQIVVAQPETPKVDPLPPDLSTALKTASYNLGWEWGYVQYRNGDESAVAEAVLQNIAHTTELQKQAATASSTEAREKIFAELRGLVDELNKINQRLRQARHDGGDTRDPPPRTD